MTFKELVNELMDQGWRCYYFPSIGSNMFSHTFAIRNNIEIRLYEGKSLIFVKDIKPIEDGE